MARVATLMVVVASVIWATGGPVIKILMDYGLRENEVFFAKGLFCFLSMLLLNCVFRKKICIIKDKKDWILCTICGVVGYLFYGMFYGYAVKRIPMSIAVVLVYTAPAIVTVYAAVILKEKLTRQKKLCLCMIMLGCIFVTGVLQEGFGNLSMMGIFWGLASGVSFAVYSITSSMLMKKYDAWTVTTYNFLLSFLGVSFMVDITSTLHKIFSDEMVLFTCIYFALFCGTVSNLIYVKAMAYLTASTASMITTIEPLTTCLIGFFLFQEDLSISKALGIGLILGAIVLLNCGKETKKKGIVQAED